MGMEQKTRFEIDKSKCIKCGNGEYMERLIAAKSSSLPVTDPAWSLQIHMELKA